MGGVLRIEAQHSRDAECIRDALEDHGATSTRHGRVVLLPHSGDGDVLMTVLTALHACLKDDEIAAVKVIVDEHTYLMRASLA